MFYIYGIFDSGDIKIYVFSGVGGEYPAVFYLIAFFVRNTFSEVGLPGEIPDKELGYETRTEIKITNFIENQENSSENKEYNK